MSRTARTAAAAALAALLCTGATATASAAVTNGSTKVTTSTRAGNIWSPAPMAGTNSVSWD